MSTITSVSGSNYKFTAEGSTVEQSGSIINTLARKSRLVEQVAECDDVISQFKAKGGVLPS